MPPLRERLRIVAGSPEGSLEDVPYAVLLAALASERRTCVALLSHRRTEKRVSFVEGSPVDCRSNMVHETFGRFLVAQGKITEDQFALAHAQSASRGILVGEILVEQGILTPDDVLRMLQQNLARKLLDGFTWKEGGYRLLAETPVVSAPLKVNVAQLIVTGVAKLAPQAAVDAAVGALVGKRLALDPAAPFPLEELRLNERQARLAAALEKRPRIDELATSAGLPFDEITRLLHALTVLGTVVPADQLRAAPGAAPSAASAPAPPSPAVPAAGSAAAAPASPAARAAAVHAAWETHRGKDPFDLLGLPDDAGEEAIRARYLERAREWAPWQFEGPDASEARDEAAALFLAAGKAFGKLAERESREALRQARRPAAAPAKTASGVFAIKTDLLDPEAQHRKGAELLAAGNLKGALSYLEFAADCDPQNGSYAADVSWCRYLLSGRSTSATTIAELDEAIRIDPKSGIACFYAGEVLRGRGEAQRAEPYYRKAAKLMAPDRRPLDALREMTRTAPR